MNLAGSTPLKVSSPFLIDLAVVGSVETETRFDRIARLIKEVVCDWGCFVPEADRVSIVRFAGPRLQNIELR